MGQGQLSALPTSHKQALVFTDARGQVVFVDNNFLRMMSRSSSGAIVGSPLHRVMGIEPDTAAQLLHDAARQGSFTGRVLALQTDDGMQLHVACSSVATYDDQNAFIGADMTLVEVEREAEPPEAEPAADAATGGEHMADESAVLSLYFVSVIQALQDLLARVGGERPRQKLATIVNETANRAEWPVLIQDGRVYTEVHRDEGDIYRGLLARAVSYATGVMGSEPVRRALARLDEQTDAAVLDLAIQYGLRDLIHSQ